MTIRLAATIVQRLGPCRIAIDERRHGALSTELRLLGCAILDAGGADAVVVEWGEPRPPASALALIAPGLARAEAERALFAEGWARHPATFLSGVGAALPEVAFYKRGAGGLFARGDLQAAETLARFAAAGGHVRAGDRVLVMGAHAADGTALLRANTRAGSVETAADGRFDTVIALDPPGDWRAALATATALLKLDGRLVAGWPDGAGPEDWAELSDALCEDYLLDARYLPGPGGTPVRGALHAAQAGGWLMAAAAVNPIGAEAARGEYAHPAFGDHAPLVDFATGYDNPWLYRTMVQMGERLSDEGTLGRLAEYVVEEARPGSADQGAALAVIGYRLLENRGVQAVPVLLPLIDAYVRAADDAPHGARWCISLAFLAGRLAELVGARDSAKEWYSRAAAGDWAAFAPILATKTVGACFFEGRLWLAEGDEAAARRCFGQGVTTAVAAARADHAPQLGDPDRPLAFYLTELAEVIDMGSQCANALANLHLWRRDPGLFWQAVDVKRFGLASWAIDLARENERLRMLLARQSWQRAA